MHTVAVAEPIDEYFTATLSGLGAPSAGNDDVLQGLSAQQCLDVFDAQLGSRHLDLAARWLRSKNRGFYTIGSSGHESNAAVAAALRPTDPALLHYRSGGFFLARARQVDGSDALRDVLLGMVAATDEPISGGRHKVFGRHDLHVIPQTSTIASHLPRALGVAFSIARSRKLGIDSPWPADALAVCSFGDASANHSTAVGAVNAAMHTAYQGVPMPLLFVCEDNGIGISVKTPQRLDRAHLQRARGPALLHRRRDRPARGADRRGAGRGIRSRPAPSGVPASAYGAVDGACRVRLRARATAEPTRSPPTTPATRCWARRACSSQRACARPVEVLDRYEEKRVEGDRRWPPRSPNSAQLDSARGGDGPAARSARRTRSRRPAGRRRRRCAARAPTRR